MPKKMIVPKKTDSAVKVKVFEMDGAGRTVPEIAMELRLSQTAVYKWLRDRRASAELEQRRRSA